MCKRTTDIWNSTHPLWFDPANQSGRRCFCFWCGCSYLPCIPWRFRVTNCLRVTYFDCQWEKLCTTREGGIIIGIPYQEVSSVFIRKKIHPHHWSSASDNHPGTEERILSLAAARLQRWAVILAAYVYVIKYKSTHTHSNADDLSRLPFSSSDAPSSRGISILNIGQVQALPVTFWDVQKAARQDKTLSKVLTYVQNGWPKQVPDELKPYQGRQNEIGIECDCLMWGIRVIIPGSLQPKVLRSLHENHPGITRMKAMAQSYFWWSGLDKAVEGLSKSYSACQSLQAAPAAAPLHPWLWLDAPWKRIHVDFAGPFLGWMYFYDPLPSRIFLFVWLYK